MTNTRLTDPEVLEARYPVVLREFAIRAGSGGHGRRAGGDGILREVEFRRPLTLSLLTNRRTTRPFGLEGGEAGKRGQNLLLRANCQQQELDSQCEVEVQPGDRLRLLTPGGGGFGKTI
jgi:5-oxoprolinase (ATP-hydrolysing)